MLHLQSSIDIDVPVATAFGLLCDVERHAELNPQVESALVTLPTGHALGPGSRLYYRLETATGIQTFTSTVVAFEPDRLLELVSDTTPPFRVRMMLEGTLYGCNLRHEEWIEPGAAQLQAGSRARPVPYLLRVLHAATGYSMPSRPQFDQALHDSLRVHLEQTLDTWLVRIKAHLEAPRRHEPADESALAT